MAYLWDLLEVGIELEKSSFHVKTSDMPVFLANKRSHNVNIPPLPQKTYHNSTVL